MPKSARFLGLLAGLAWSLAAWAEPALAPSSPFLPPDASAAAGSAENTPLELRGILRDTDGFRFSIFDPAKKSGQWVRLNEPGHDFTVRTHDVAHDSVTLDFQGRVLTLPLHTAKVMGLTVAETPASGPRLTPGSTGIGPVPKPPSPEEAARYNRAVEEINRRRALREKGPMPTPK